MRLGYSERLRSNYLIIDAAAHGGDRGLTVEHIVRTARMHRCARIKGGKTFIAVAIGRGDGSREAERLVQEHQLQALIQGLTTVS